MKKILLLAAVSVLLCSNAFATYTVVLRNGTTYKAKAKWTVVNGKAMVALENGQTLQLDPSLIDERASETQTHSGLGDARILEVQTDTQAPARPQQPSLGAGIRLRRPGSTTPSQTPAASAPVPVSAPTGASLGQEIIDKFAKAYENVGLFEQKLVATGPHSLRAELTADTEDKVFNAISATSFLMVRNAGINGAQIDQVELFMKTTNGGSSGRFQMSREDAMALDTKKISQQDYFVHKVIF
jgi:hypothetical protein